MPRPMKGMFKRGAGYYVRLREEGKDRWISLGSDYEDATRKLRSFRRDGAPPKPSQVRVSDVADRWCGGYLLTSRNPKGAQLAIARTRQYLLPFMGHMLLDKVTVETLRGYRLWLGTQMGKRTGRPLSAQSVRHILADARCLFRWCADAGLMPKAPIPRNLLPKVQERPPDRLSDSDVAQLVSLPEPYGFFVRLAVGTGLRWGELCRANAGDVQNEVLIVGHTKSYKVRRVPLGRELQRELLSRTGKLVPFSYKSNGSLTGTIRKLSGIGSFHIHQLRHTFACRWVERGGSLAALQQILGHSSVVTTQRYARLADDIVLREARRVDERGFQPRILDGSVADVVASVVATG